MKTKVIILAGGKGTRMQSDIPKTLHRVGEKTLLGRILESVLPIDQNPVIVVGHKGEEVINETGGRYSYVWQKEQLGTGHAVWCAREKFLEDDEKKTDSVIVVSGDVPLVKTETLERLLEQRADTDAAIALAVATVPNFEGIYAGFEKYGRILKNEAGDVRGIIEWKDASEAKRAIREVNAGLYCFRSDFLWENIGKLENTNATKEFYLTDLIVLAVNVGEKVCAIVLENPLEGLGVNTQEELAVAEEAMTIR